MSLNARGDGGTGWSKAWKINFWARLLDGNHAHKMLVEQLRTSTLPNLWDTHPPFQIDGKFGATSGVTEMLLQSHTGEIRLLPALPAAWRSGSVIGLRARGAFTVDQTWTDARPTQVELVSDRGGTARLRHAGFAAGTSQVTNVTTGASVQFTRNGEQVSFATTAGQRYRVAISYGSARVGQITGIGGKCVDVAGSATADGTKIQLWTCNGTGAQNWAAQADGTLRNPQSGKCLDASGGGTADGTQLVIWTCSAAANQKWTLP